MNLHNNAYADASVQHITKDPLIPLMAASPSEAVKAEPLPLFYRPCGCLAPLQ